MKRTLLLLLFFIPTISFGQINIDSTLAKLINMKVGDNISMDKLFDSEGNRRFISTIDSV